MTASVETIPTSAAAATVLVVDDDHDLRESVKDILECSGYSVALARHGEEALVYLRENTLPEVILLDLSMPVMDGATFREEQLRDPKLALIPVLLFSAAANVNERIRPLALTGFLRKPFDIDDLLVAVEKIRCKPKQ